MNTYFIVQNPPQTTPKEIFTALDGRGYVQNDELHLISAQVHYIYIYDWEGDPEGWYMENCPSCNRYYLGEGASPTINLTDIEILDEEYWALLSYIPEEGEEV